MVKKRDDSNNRNRAGLMRDDLISLILGKAALRVTLRSSHTSAESRIPGHMASCPGNNSSENGNIYIYIYVIFEVSRLNFNVIGFGYTIYNWG